ncbi:hypothetical protein GCM10027568_21300 [Humibacter soli]
MAKAPVGASVRREKESSCRGHMVILGGVHRVMRSDDAGGSRQRDRKMTQISRLSLARLTGLSRGPPTKLVGPGVERGSRERFGTRS